MWDFFISHASEDKDIIVRPLFEKLTQAGYKVWYDEFTLLLGDSLRQSIEKGLAESTYGIVILSHSFFSKDWPQKELNALFSRELDSGKVILPVWHRINRQDVLRYAPLIADKLAVQTEKGLDYLVEEIQRVLKRIDSSNATIHRNVVAGEPFAAQRLLSDYRMTNYVSWTLSIVNNSFNNYELSEVFPIYRKYFLMKKELGLTRYFPLTLHPNHLKINNPDIIYESDDYFPSFSNLFFFTKVIFRNNEIVYSAIQIKDQQQILLNTRIPFCDFLYLFRFLELLYQNERLPIDIELLLRVTAPQSTYYYSDTEHSLFHISNNMFHSYLLKEHENVVKFNLKNFENDNIRRFFKKIYGLFICESPKSTEPFLEMQEKDFDHVYSNIKQGNFE
jgi:hypothetical protein